MKLNWKHWLGAVAIVAGISFVPDPANAGAYEKPDCHPCKTDGVHGKSHWKP